MNEDSPTGSMLLSDAAAAPTPDETQRVREWRTEQFLTLGLPPAASVMLALSGVDLGAARRLMQHGCPTELAASILL